MEKRAYERIPANVEIRFYCCNKVYAGTVMNISENGMFINAKEMCFPFDLQFEIFIPLKEENLNVHAALHRIMISPDSYNGLGVELLNPTRGYLEFVESLKSAL